MFFPMNVLLECVPELCHRFIHGVRLSAVETPGVRVSLRFAVFTEEKSTAVRPMCKLMDLCRNKKFKSIKNFN